MCGRIGGNCRRAAAPPIGRPFKIRFDKRIHCVEVSCFWDCRQPEAELIACFATAAPFAIVKGFAIGRTIFQDVARAWFAGAMSDAAALKAMAANFSRLANAWHSARTAVAI